MLSTEVVKSVIEMEMDMSLKITHLKSQLHLPGANELTEPEALN